MPVEIIRVIGIKDVTVLKTNVDNLVLQTISFSLPLQVCLADFGISVGRTWNDPNSCTILLCLIRFSLGLLRTVLIKSFPPKHSREEEEEENPCFVALARLNRVW